MASLPTPPSTQQLNRHHDTPLLTPAPPSSPPLLLAGGADRLPAAARRLGVLPAHAHAPVVADAAVRAVYAWWWSLIRWGRRK